MGEQEPLCNLMHLAYASLCILCMFLCIAWRCGGRCGGVDGGEQVCPPLLRSETATTRPLRCCGFVSAVVQQRPASGQRIAGASTQATPTHAGHAVHAPDCVCVGSCVCSPPPRPRVASVVSCAGIMCAPQRPAHLQISRRYYTHPQLTLLTKHV